MTGAGRVVTGKILRWGNSYGLRLTKNDVEAAHLEPGQDVLVVLKPETPDLEASNVPTFHSGRRDMARRHDELLADAALADLDKRKGPK